MADAELLLTVNGTDVTTDIWSWSSVWLSDAWNAHPTLRFVLRQDFTRAAAVSIPAYADVRLVNLLTGQVLFEGVAAEPLEESTEDPHWINRSVSAVGYQALLDTSYLQVPYTIDMSLGGAYPTTASVIRAVLARSFADYRVPSSVTTYNYGSTSSWGSDDLIISQTWAAGTPAASVIADVLAQSLSREGYGTGPLGDGAWPRGVLFKHLAGLGWVLSSPGSAVRGTAPVSFTGGARPAGVVKTTDTSGLASAIWAVDQHTLGTADDTQLLVNDTSTTNGYVVAKASFTAPFNWDSSSRALVTSLYFADQGAASAFWSVVTPRTPADIQVGHSLTIEHPYWGTITAAVQAISTRFVDGQFDTTATGLPYMLDGSRNFDGTWNLDATATSGTPRRMRITTLTMAATSGADRRTFVGAYRASAR